MRALDDIAAERRRQIEQEGFSAQHDRQQNALGEMAFAASLYALNAAMGSRYVACGKIPVSDIEALVAACPPPSGWPWHPKWWKPKSRRQDLVRAAALLVAEIDRLDSTAGAGETQPQ